MNLSDLARKTKYKYDPPKPPDCSSPSDEELAREGLDSAGFVLSPQKASERIEICRSCKYHAYRDALKRVGLKCTLRPCAANKEGRFLAMRCMEGRW